MKKLNLIDILSKEKGDKLVAVEIFLDSNVVSLNPTKLLWYSELSLEDGIKDIVYVKDDEFRLFREYIQPLAQKLAGQKRVVLCDFESDFVLSEQDFPLVIIDAGRITFIALKKLLRLEAPQGLCDYLANPENIALIHFCNIGATKEDLRPLMTSFLDGRFGSSERAKNTHIVTTGVYGQLGIKNCLSPSVICRAFCAGVDWGNP